MRHRIFPCTTRDGTRLFAQEWLPSSEPKAAVCLVHGLGEHGGRYWHAGDFLAERGYALLALDLRGHGRSEGRRGHVPRFDAFMDDLARFLAETRRAHPDLPLFLYGHSLGGILVINYALRANPDVRGVILSAPALRTSPQGQLLKVILARLLGRLIPRVSLTSGIRPDALSRDRVVCRAYASDPLVHNRLTLGMAACVLRARTWALDHAGQWRLPALIMHGTGDSVALVSASEEFARKASGDCTVKLWPGLFHELHNEPEKDQVLANVCGWMEARLS